MTSKLCPLVAVCPCPGAIYIYYIIKKKYIRKNRLQRDFFLKLAINDRSDKLFLMTSKVRPKGLSAPAPGLYTRTCIKSWKNVYKIRLQRDLFETCSKWPKWQEVSVDIKNFVPWGCLPHLRLYTFIKSWKDVYKVRGWRDCFETCNKRPKWWGLPVGIKVLALMGCLTLPKGYVHV